jgi:mono/diheme cytochrome c family protein
VSHHRTVPPSLRRLLPPSFAIAAALGLTACGKTPPAPVSLTASVQPDREATGPVVRAASPVEAGRYLIVVGGCNDCHTPGYAATGGNIPESMWLIGSPVGFRGPWGVTYASNLRLTLKDMKADDWVTIAKSRNAKPPMPWAQLHGMSDADLRAVYAYVKSLPVTGPVTPAYVPPGKEPATPYVDFVPKNLPTGDGAAPAPAK